MGNLVNCGIGQDLLYEACHNTDADLRRIAYELCESEYQFPENRRLVAEFIYQQLDCRIPISNIIDILPLCLQHRELLLPNFRSLAFYCSHSILTYVADGGRIDLSLKDSHKILTDPHKITKEGCVALLSYAQYNTVPTKPFKKALRSNSLEERAAALVGLSNTLRPPLSAVEKALMIDPLRDDLITDSLITATVSFCESNLHISSTLIAKWAGSQYPLLHLAAISACINRSDIHGEFLQEIVRICVQKDEIFRTQLQAMRACENHPEIPFNIIRKGLESIYREVRSTASRTLRCHKELPIDHIFSMWSTPKFRLACMEACQDRKDIPTSFLAKGISCEYPEIKIAALKACQGRKDLPENLIREQLRCHNLEVQRIAKLICAEQGFAIATIRDVEPSGPVVKHCLGDVTVIAEIPPDAEIRMDPRSGKCRSNKATIIDIQGAFYGIKIGISAYDYQTTYSIGESIYIPDFDLSHAECSTGFHFYLR